MSTNLRRPESLLFAVPTPRRPSDYYLVVLWCSKHICQRTTEEVKYYNCQGADITISGSWPLRKQTFKEEWYKPKHPKSGCNPSEHLHKIWSNKHINTIPTQPLTLQKAQTTQYYRQSFGYSKPLQHRKVHTSPNKEYISPHHDNPGDLC